MFAVQVGLSGAAAKRQAKSLAKMRAKMVQDQHRAELARLRTLIKSARQRRGEALRKAVQQCRRHRLDVRERVKRYRSAALQMLRNDVRTMRQQARNQCQARKHRIRTAGHSAAERARRELVEARRLQGQLQRLEQAAMRKRARLVSGKERAQESDDAVRSNLPTELHGVWAKVKRTIKAGERTTRTEAFLQWAESHPEDVLAMQSNDADREVRQLVKEHEALEREHYRPRKTTGAEARALEAIGLAPNKATARRRAAAIGWEDPPF
jgi:hypothetical protein